MARCEKSLCMCTVNVGGYSPISAMVKKHNSFDIEYHRQGLIICKLIKPMTWGFFRLSLAFLYFIYCKRSGHNILFFICFDVCLLSMAILSGHSLINAISITVYKLSMYILSMNVYKTCYVISSYAMVEHIYFVHKLGAPSRGIQNRTPSEFPSVQAYVMYGNIFE